MTVGDRTPPLERGSLEAVQEYGRRLGYLGFVVAGNCIFVGLYLFLFSAMRDLVGLSVLALEIVFIMVVLGVMLVAVIALGFRATSSNPQKARTYSIYLYTLGAIEALLGFSWFTVIIQLSLLIDLIDRGQAAVFPQRKVALFLAILATAILVIVYLAVRIKRSKSLLQGLDSFRRKSIWVMRRGSGSGAGHK